MIPQKAQHEFTYEFTKHADRQLRKLPVSTQQRIIRKIRYYLQTGNPLRFADSIKNAAGKIYRFRVGDHRVIFDWEDGKILVS